MLLVRQPHRHTVPANPLHTPAQGRVSLPLPPSLSLVMANAVMMFMARRHSRAALKAALMGKRGGFANGLTSYCRGPSSCPMAAIWPPTYTVVGNSSRESSE